MALGNDSQRQLSVHRIRGTHEGLDGEVVGAVHHGGDAGGADFHPRGELAAVQAERLHALKDLLDDEQFFHRDHLGKGKRRGEKALNFVRLLSGDLDLHGRVAGSEAWCRRKPWRRSIVPSGGRPVGCRCFVRVWCSCCRRWWR